LSLKETAQTIAVVDNESYLLAGQFAKDIKDCKSKVEAYFKPLKDAANKAHKAITQREAEELKPLKEADTIIRGQISVYLSEQERLRKEAQAKAEAVAAERSASKGRGSGRRSRKKRAGEAACEGCRC